MGRNTYRRAAPSQLALLRSAGKLPSETLHGIWEAAERSGRTRAMAFYEALGRRFLSAGQPIIAFNVFEKGLEHWPASLPLLKFKALALARSGATSTARDILEELRTQGRASHDALGILARTYKDLWERTRNPSVAGRHLSASHRLYYDTYRDARRHHQANAAIYTGINAAATAFLLCRKRVARQIARDVRRICRSQADPGNYWTAATLGECAVILGDLDEAARQYRAAADMAGDNYGDLGTTRRQARLLLKAQGQPSDRLDPCFGIPAVIAFAGHMVDQRYRPVPRFPPELEEPVRQALAEHLRRYPHRIGFSSAARGSDILFQEAMLRNKNETHVVLPFRNRDFVRSSVDIPPRGNWKHRFARVVGHATSVTVASAHRVSGSSVGYEYANKLLNGMAILRAEYLHAEVVPLAIWNGKEGDGLGGTASHVRFWRSRNVPVDVIDITAAWQNLPADRRQSIARRAERLSRGNTPPPHLKKDPRKIMAILMADLERSSRLTEEQVPLFVDRFLGSIGKLIARSRRKPIVRNTWGDGIYLVFRRVEDAGLFALELQDMVSRTNWRRQRLPDNLKLRTALHVGPLYKRTDPVSGMVTFFGTPVIRTARIEPVALAGQVYASLEFAALAAAEGVRSFRCHYIGEQTLNKVPGTHPLYHVHRTP